VGLRNRPGVLIVCVYCCIWTHYCRSPYTGFSFVDVHTTVTRNTGILSRRGFTHDRLKTSRTGARERGGLTFPWGGLTPLPPQSLHWLLMFCHRMFAQLSQETRVSRQGGVSHTAKQTTSRVQYPCVQIQQYTQTIKTPGQENPSDQCYARYYSVSTRD